jgi:NAD-dependent dihydropyrimidine dehydrogenase PreA subunit
VIVVYAERCDGCGACVEVCPTGALYLVDGKVAVELSLCRECEACLTACPREAIVDVDELKPVAGPARVPALRPESQVMQVKDEPASLPMRSRVLPLVGAALAWAGRELVLHLADYVLYDLDRRPTGRRMAGKRADERGLARGGGVQPRRHRHRRRGGSSER